MYVDLILHSTHSLPAILHVRTELYSSLISVSLSLIILSHIKLTCLNVKRGMSRLFGESALNKAVELAVDKDGTLELSITFSCELDAEGGGLEQPGKCNCLRFCRRRISILRFAAICSEKEAMQDELNTYMHKS